MQEEIPTLLYKIQDKCFRIPELAMLLQTAELDHIFQVRRSYCIDGLHLGSTDSKLNWYIDAIYPLAKLFWGKSCIIDFSR